MKYTTQFHFNVSHDFEVEFKKKAADYYMSMAELFRASFEAFKELEAIKKEKEKKIT